MKKLLIVFGTRPEAIKMAPLIHQIKSSDLPIETKVCVTGQHRELIEPVLSFFNLRPEYNFDIMTPFQTLTQVTVRILEKMEELFLVDVPDLVLVHGDTTTALASALAAYYSGIPVGHIEAGLRSGNIYEPFPEEINRRLIAGLACLHFAPTFKNRDNLIQEGVSPQEIFVTGNTGIDALLEVADVSFSPSGELGSLANWNKIVLATIHRRENHGQPLIDICTAINQLAAAFPEVAFVIPAHPGVAERIKQLLESPGNVMVLPALGYLDFVWLMKKSTIILTDSGGIQEEAPALGVPVLALRNITERPEAVAAGSVLVVGSKTQEIYDQTSRLLLNTKLRQKLASGGSPYGDGNAAKRIVEILKKYFKCS